MSVKERDVTDSTENDPKIRFPFHDRRRNLVLQFPNKHLSSLERGHERAAEWWSSKVVTGKEAPDYQTFGLENLSTKETSW